MEATRTESPTINRITPFTGTPAIEEFGATETALSLRGQVALISGATGGIGRCAAIALAQRGAVIAANHNGDSSGSESVCEVISAFGTRALPVSADIGDDTACAAMVAAVFETLGQIDILVHAIDLHNDIPFHQMHRYQWDEAIRVQLGGAYNLARAVINPMRQRGYGRIVFVSQAACGADSHAGALAATGGLIGLTRTLAAENARHGITANCICPGLIETPNALESIVRNRKKIESRLPAGRAGRPEEVASLIEFLTSDRAAYITGQELHIDGGFSI